MLITDILEELMLLPAPSGYEKPVAYYLREKLSQYAEKVDIDVAGNVLARMPGTQPGAPTVMIYAHMDQLGFIIRRIDPQGFLRVERLGGIPEKVLPGLQVLVLTAGGRRIPGVIGSKSHHVTPPEEKYRVDPIADLYIDIGAGSAAAVREMGIEVGCPAVYRPAFQTLAGGRISGTSVDNRGGLAVLLRLAELLKKQPAAPAVWLVGSVWEEFNLRGAALAARTCAPDAAIALDVVLAGDTPDLQDKFDVQVGGGPAVMLYNFHGRGTLNGTIPHPGLVSLAEQTAAGLNMNLQRFAGVGILTDSAYVQLEGKGIAALELGFPARYTHTPVEICAPDDLVQLADLIHAMLNKLDSSFNCCRY